MSVPGAVRRIELLQVRAPDVPPFVLALETQSDRIIAPHIRANAIWEAPETALCRRLLRAGMCAVDAGAHAGYYSVLFSHLVGASGSVLAFEPHPSNFRLLLANLLLNDCGNVRAQPLALAERGGSAWLHLSSDNAGDHRLAATPGRARVAVETIDLDTALDGTAVDFIKIDTQGAEPRILAGMSAMLRANRDRLGCLLEFAPGLQELAGTSVAQFAAQLGALDARVFAIAMDNGVLELRRLNVLHDGLANLAAELARTWNGQVDASCDVFAVFGEAAQTSWLTRFREGAVG